MQDGDAVSMRYAGFLHRWSPEIRNNLVAKEPEQHREHSLPGGRALHRQIVDADDPDPI